MQRHTRSAAAFTIVEAVTICLLLLILAWLLLPALRPRHRADPTMQNSTQLRGIHQAMFTFAQSNKTGGRDGFYPGLDARGRTLPVADVLPAAELQASADVPGYAAEPLGHVLRREMNTTPTQGFVTRVFAELVAGDFIPAGSAGYFINPRDEVKREFEPGGGTPFTAANVSYAVLDLSRHDGDAYPLAVEWKESLNTQAVILADRAVGGGDDPATRSSVWTEPGSGQWRGSVVRNDGSTSHEVEPRGEDLGLRYGDLTFEGGDTLNLFSGSFGLVESGGRTRLSATSGVLYDEAEAPGDADGF